MEYADSATMQGRGLSLEFAGNYVLRDVSVALNAGKVRALTGENGAGKSSLAKLFAGVYRPSAGQITLNGRKVSFKSPREALDAGVALIYQEPMTFPDLTVAENIFAGSYPRRSGFADPRACVSTSRELLARLGSNLNPNTRAERLSIAERQIVEVASAMSRNSRVWIFDESTAALSPLEVNELFKVIRSLRDEGCAVGFVSHQLQEVFEISDHISVLRDGVLVADLETKQTTPADVVRAMVGRDLVPKVHERTHTDEEAVRLQDASGPGFESVTFAVGRGEIFGLVGLVGSGRTEIARALFGITKLSRGEFLLNGQQVSPRSPHDALSLGIALVPEDRIHEGLFTLQSIEFNTTIVGLRGLSKSGWVSRTRCSTVTKDLASEVKLIYQNTEQSIFELSGGNQQKVVFSKWLLTHPNFFIVDEPTRGVDVGAKQEVHRLLRNLANRGAAVLLISSDLKEVLEVSDRIGVMRAGKFVGAFEANDATEELIMQHATGAR